MTDIPLIETWHARSVEALARHLASNTENGLDNAEASRRLKQHGPNLIAELRQRGIAGMIGVQFRDAMILVLMATALLSGILGDLKDSLVILAIVLLNAAIGFSQEVRAERAMAELKRLAAHDVSVIRGGRRSTVPSATLVPGDIVLLEAGGEVPADMRLIDAIRLRVNEATLTGEAAPVEKRVAPLDDAALPFADQTNMAFKGTMVAYGRGRGMVVATGMDTRLGHIAALLENVPPTPTPLQARLKRFGRQLTVLILIVCAGIFVSGVLRGNAVMLMLLTSTSLAVAVIPEALPAVVTVMLAMGVRKLARRNALVRKLAAVETLGSVSYICTDKTGTLTLNEMRVVELYPCGEGRMDVASAAQCGSAASLFEAAALCNDVEYDVQGRPMGDPTEVALYRAAEAAGHDRRRLEKTMPRCMEFAFDSDRKRMTTFHRAAGGFVAYSKGAPEAIIERCTTMAGGNHDRADQAARFEREALLAVAGAMAEDGLRVLAIAQRTWPALPAPECLSDRVETGLTLLGLVGMLDPIRPGAHDAVATCRSAGITPVMITGDHPATARAIAGRLGMLGDGDRVMSGRELAALSEADLAACIEHVKVFARLDPAQKIRIVEAIQAHGHYVAMTGDGVNDAPALARANIGVAMGQAGTDVAREASSLVLLDDNFATIVAAVEEGRRIFDNIRKFIRYGLSGNAAELWVIMAAPVLGLPLPLLPTHILWINLLTDGLPGLALAAEPAEPRIMARPPRPPREGLFSGGMWQHILWAGLAMALVVLAVQAWALSSNHAAWQTMTFSVLAFSQMGYVLAIRSERRSLLTQGLRSNSPLLGSVLLTLALQMAAIYAPPLNTLLGTSPLTPLELAVSLAASLVIFLLVELEKYFVRHAAIRASRRTSATRAAWRDERSGQA
ncbi:cation-translocating P-type ATPase [Burkholderia gladioli]|uniref:cation-translocating P-type ATPase n=1 Tax=Burkholderia gladioli TaxID=28095 RepID=UPI00155F793E|nr:cation-translocating P-type ATPase [Burkholderia gladioli]NRF82605.1 cation-translocating P-type ATPase [Burkholderia gladioli]